MGTWGDHLTLQAAADAYGCSICLITSFLENCIITIQPSATRAQQEAQRAAPAGPGASTPTTEVVLWLAFCAEVHYTGVAPKSAAASEDSASSSSEDEGGGKLLGSSRLRRAVRRVIG